MPKISRDAHERLRQQILDATQTCFARNGIRGTTIQHICRQAQIGPAAIYRYFSSKNDLMTALCERERVKFKAAFAELSASDDPMAAFHTLARRYLVDEPVDIRRVDLELGLEATRDAALAEHFQPIDADVRAEFTNIFIGWIEEGRIAPAHPPSVLATAVMMIGDGLFWRRAVHDDFDVEAALPVALDMIATLLRPVGGAQGSARKKDA